MQHEGMQANGINDAKLKFAMTGAETPACIAMSIVMVVTRSNAPAMEEIEI